MLSYRDFTNHFGTSLSNEGFQIFLHDTFSDLTDYDILESDYITSENNGIELGFINIHAVYDEDDNVVFEKGDPIFSHFILFAISLTLIDDLPFDTNFHDNRTEVIRKAGNPYQTKEGFTDLLNKNFLVDNYKVDDIVITFDYEPEKQTINFIQIRDNNLVEHIKL
jgi:hypothetical protein